MDLKKYLENKITVKNILKTFGVFIAILTLFPIIFICGYYYRIHREKIETKISMNVDSNLDKSNYKLNLK